MTCCALAVMAKAPEPGLVKTRLVPPLSYEEAAEPLPLLARFSLKEIGELLSLRLDPETTSGDIKRRAQAKIADIEATIGDLVPLGEGRNSYRRSTVAGSSSTTNTRAGILTS